jgi:hypothetical protein
MGKAQNIFNSANIYAKLYYLLNSNTDRSQILPSNVMAALSLELYIKCIYYLEKGKDFLIKNRHSHDFHKAFLELNESTRSQIIDEYYLSLKTRDMTDIKTLEEYSKIKINTDFYPVLKEWSTIFVDVRYIYEIINKNKIINMVFYPELQQIFSTYIKKRLIEIEEK